MMELHPKDISDELWSREGVPVQNLHNGNVAALVSLEGLSIKKAQFQYIPAQAADLNQRTISLDRSEIQVDKSGFLEKCVIDGVSLKISTPVSFRLYPDYPANFDAWDIDRSTKNLGRRALPAMDFTCTDTGPLVSRIQAEGSFGTCSNITITYTLLKGQPYVYMDITVNWQEEHKLLTLELPTEYTSLTSRFGTPFGSIDRKTARGAIDKEAMWELPASRWLAVTDGMHNGIAVLSADTYGYSVTDGTIELSLLRSPCSSDEQGITGEEIFAEKGAHSFSFILGRYCPETTKDQLSTAQAADTLFLQPNFLPAQPIDPPFKASELGSLVISWVKPAEKKNGYIVRMHETAGASGRANIKLMKPKGAQAELVDLLERQQKPLEICDGTIYVDYFSYALLSLRITWE